MPHGRATAQSRDVPGGNPPGREGALPPSNHRGGRVPPTQALPSDLLPVRDRVGARKRTGPKPFVHNGTWTWTDDAACADSPDPRQFFPEDHFDLKDPNQLGVYLGAVEAVAAAYCRECLVRLDCEEHARTHKEQSGIWAGKGPLERGVWK